jgi:hypothetical protein
VSPRTRHLGTAPINFVIPTGFAGRNLLFLGMTNVTGWDEKAGSSFLHFAAPSVERRNDKQLRCPESPRVDTPWAVGLRARSFSQPENGHGQDDAQTRKPTKPTLHRHRITQILHYAQDDNAITACLPAASGERFLWPTRFWDGTKFRRCGLRWQSIPSDQKTP